MGQNAANLLFCWKMAKIYWGLILVTLNPLLLLLLMFVFFFSATSCSATY